MHYTSGRTLLFAAATLCLGLWSIEADAQWEDSVYHGNRPFPATTTPVRPADTYVQILFNGPCVPMPDGCNVGGTLPLSSFANVNALSAKIDSGLAAIAGAQNQIVDLSNRVAAINSQIANMNRGVSRSLEIGAIAASMRDAIPNHGDRFAIRLNAAGFDGYAGGSLGVSVNLTDSIRFSANYGRGATQNVVSGGLNISFR